jgi:hypothetical protein
MSISADNFIFAVDFLLESGEIVRVPFVRSPDKRGTFTAAVTYEGAVLSVTDTERAGKDGLSIARTVRAEIAGTSVSGYSFETEVATGFPADAALFFAPSCYYGSLSTPAKFAYDGSQSSGTVDSLGAPVLAAYYGGCGLALSDRTAGRRETVDGDFDAGVSKNIVADGINLAGLGIRNRNANAALLHSYPGTTYRFNGCDAVIRRFTRATSVAYAFHIAEASAGTFADYQKTVWRGEYGRLAKIDGTVDVRFALQELVNAVCRSYRVVNGIPQLCTDTDHFVPESGFLYRNADLAALLLGFKAEGYAVPLPDEALIDIIDTQVATGYAGRAQFFPFWRSRFEGALAVLNGYTLLQRQGNDKKEWLQYALSEADVACGTDEYFSVPLLCAAYKQTKNGNYLAAAEEKCERVWTERFSKGLFSGGIMDFGGSLPPLDKESGLLGLAAFLALYDANRDKKNIDRAAACAAYAETYQQLQDINLEPQGFDDTKDAHALGTGNAHVSTRGLGFIACTCAAGDTYSAVAAGAYLVLGRLTKDKHYTHYADYLFRNSFLTMSLGDKAGGMADFAYSRGNGFFNEYIQMGISTDPVGRGRGCMHDSNIAWCPYVLLQAALDIKRQTGSFFTSDKRAKTRYKQLAETSASGPYLTDGNYAALCDVSGGGAVTLHYPVGTAIDKCVITFQNPYKAYRYRLVAESMGKITLAGDFVHEKGKCAVHTVGQVADTLTLAFAADTENGYLRQIQVFGMSGGEQSRVPKVAPVTAVALFVEKNPQVCYAKEGSPIPFDNATNSYLTDGAEFLKGRLCRLCNATAQLTFSAEKGKYVFHFSLYPFENCGGTAEVRVTAGGKELFARALCDRVGSYVTAVIEGETQICFRSAAAVTVQYEFFREGNE